MTTREMEAHLSRHFDPRRNIIIPNASWGLGLHECDLLVVSEAGYATEVEIKISKSDLRADVKKTHDHQSSKIKFLYFAVPITLAAEILFDASTYEKPGTRWKPPMSRGLLPAGAGILLVSSRGHVLCALKATANPHAKPFNDKDWRKFAKLMTCRYWSQHQTISDLRSRLKATKSS